MTSSSSKTWTFTRAGIRVETNSSYTVPFSPAVEVKHGDTTFFITYENKGTPFQHWMGIPGLFEEFPNSFYFEQVPLGVRIGYVWNDMDGYGGYDWAKINYEYTGTISLTLQENGLYTKIVQKDERSFGEVQDTGNGPDGIFSYVTDYASKASDSRFYIGSYQKNDVDLDLSLNPNSDLRSIATELWQSSTDSGNPIFRQIWQMPGGTIDPDLFVSVFVSECDLAVSIDPPKASPFEVGVEFILKAIVTRKSGSKPSDVDLTVILPRGFRYVGDKKDLKIESAGDATKLVFSIGSVDSQKALDIKVIATEESRPKGSPDTAKWKAEITANVASKAALIVDPVIDNNSISLSIDVTDIDLEAVDDEFKLETINKPLSLNILANDSASNKSNLKIIITKPSQEGVLTVEKDGTVTYTSGQILSGLDYFTYIIQDENGDISDPANVTVSFQQPEPLRIKGKYTEEGAGKYLVSGDVEVGTFNNQIPFPSLSIHLLLLKREACSMTRGR